MYSKHCFYWPSILKDNTPFNLTKGTAIRKLINKQILIMLMQITSCASVDLVGIHNFAADA